jgi:hypothetical protein
MISVSCSFYMPAASRLNAKRHARAPKMGPAPILGREKTCLPPLRYSKMHRDSNSGCENSPLHTICSSRSSRSSKMERESMLKDPTDKTHRPLVFMEQPFPNAPCPDPAGMDQAIIICIHIARRVSLHLLRAFVPLVPRRPVLIIPLTQNVPKVPVREAPMLPKPSGRCIIIPIPKPARVPFVPPKWNAF